MGIILDICEKRKVGEYATFCTVLTAYAESDFKWDARSKHPTSSGHYSEGVFQQTLPWWDNDHFDVTASTNAFLDEFLAEKSVGDVIRDCWNVQHWNDTPSFDTSVETQNYFRRLIDIKRLIRDRHI